MHLPRGWNLIHTIWHHRTVGQRGTLVIAIPILCLITILGAWSWTRQDAIAIHTRIDRLENILTESDAVLLALTDAETAVRAYALVQDDHFLDQFNHAHHRLTHALDQLEQSIQQQASSDVTFIQLQRQVDQHFALLNYQLNWITSSAEAQARSPELNRLWLQQLLKQGEQQMYQCRQTLQAVQQIYRTQWRYQYTQLNRVRYFTDWILWLMISASILGCLATVVLIQRLGQELYDQTLHLQESETLMDAIVEHVVDGVVVLNSVGQIESFNPAAAQMFDYQPWDVITQDLSILLNPPAIAAPLSSPPKPFLQTQSINLERPWQTLGYRRTGTAFPIELSISMLDLDDRLIVIIRDITAYQQAQQTLQIHVEELARINGTLARTNAMLAERNRELDQFAYVASHDLKAPLRAIASLSEWLEDDLSEGLSEESRHQMGLLRGRVHRMEALINGLLDYARAGRGQTQCESVDVHELIQKILQGLNLPPNFQVEITSTLPMFLTKRHLLTQVFRHLIDNAVKHHNRSDGMIQISAFDQGDRYEFQVTDDGPGIAPRYHDKVFVIFQTLESRDIKEGSGVGLSIAKKIVELEGGSIHLESKEGEGTTLRFTWLKHPNP